MVTDIGAAILHYLHLIISTILVCATLAATTCSLSLSLSEIIKLFLFIYHLSVSNSNIWQEKQIQLQRKKVMNLDLDFELEGHLLLPPLPPLKIRGYNHGFGEGIAMSVLLTTSLNKTK